LNEKVYIRLPANIPEYVTEKYPMYKSGRVMRVNKSVYGLKVCPRSYYSWFRKRMIGLDYVEVMPSIYVYFKEKKLMSMVYVHVDDALAGCQIRSSNLENEFERMRQGGIPFGECVHINEVPRKFLGLHMNVRHEHDIIHISTHEYVKSVMESMTSEQSMKAYSRKLGKGEFMYIDKTES